MSAADKHLWEYDHPYYAAALGYVRGWVDREKEGER